MSKILIVEDDPNLAESYSLLLDKEGFETARASDGNEALQQADKFEPDLILLDLVMPQATGFDFLKQFRKSSSGKPKIMVLSNLSTFLIELQALGLGANQFFIKSSMSPKQLVAAIRAELS